MIIEYTTMSVKLLGYVESHECREDDTDLVWL